MKRPLPLSGRPTLAATGDTAAAPTPPTVSAGRCRSRPPHPRRRSRPETPSAHPSVSLFHGRSLDGGKEIPMSGASRTRDPRRLLWPGNPRNEFLASAAPTPLYPSLEYKLVGTEDS